jgi:hypothetical protein
LFNHTYHVLNAEAVTHSLSMMMGVLTVFLHRIHQTAQQSAGRPTMEVVNNNNEPIYFADEGQYAALKDRDIIIRDS